MHVCGRHRRGAFKTRTHAVMETVFGGVGMMRSGLGLVRTDGGEVVVNDEAARSKSHVGGWRKKQKKCPFSPLLWFVVRPLTLPFFTPVSESHRVLHI